MTKPNDLSDAELDALIYHYKRIRGRIADNLEAMNRLEALVSEKNRSHYCGHKRRNNNQPIITMTLTTLFCLVVVLLLGFGFLYFEKGDR